MRTVACEAIAFSLADLEVKHCNILKKMKGVFFATSTMGCQDETPLVLIVLHTEGMYNLDRYLPGYILGFTIGCEDTPAPTVYA